MTQSPTPTLGVDIEKQAALLRIMCTVWMRRGYRARVMSRWQRGDPGPRSPRDKAEIQKHGIHLASKPGSSAFSLTIDSTQQAHIYIQAVGSRVQEKECQETDGDEARETLGAVWRSRGVCACVCVYVPAHMHTCAYAHTGFGGGVEMGDGGQWRGWVASELAQGFETVPTHSM